MMDLQLSIEVDARATNRLVDILGDVFSPATEALGMFGQVVRLARLNTEAKIAKRAKEIANGHGLQLSMPPLKFLVPYFEKASIEAENSEELVDAWAKLLVTSGSAYEARQVRFCSMLSEMSGEQVRIIHEVANNFGEAVTDRTFEILRQDFVKYDVRNYISELYAETHTKAFDQVLKLAKRPGVSIANLEYDIADADDEHYIWNGDGTFNTDRRIDFEILVSMGVLLHISTDFISLKASAGSVHLDCYALTELGYEFWLACSGGRSLRDRQTLTGNSQT